MIIYQGTEVPDITNVQTVQENADWNISNPASKAYILNKPTIPTVNNSTITITQGGVTKGTFTLNQNTDGTISLDAGGGGSSSMTIIACTQAEYDALEEIDPDALYLITDGIQWTDITGKPSFATVATTGSYSDLTNKPTIPVVNNATITIQKNGTTLSSFDLNGTTSKTINIVVPTKTSDLTNDSNFSTFSGSYNDLSDKPTIPTVSDATITITQGGTTKGTFTLNGSATTIDLDAGGSGGGGVPSGYEEEEWVFYGIDGTTWTKKLLVG